MLSDPELVRRCVAVRERNGWPVARGPGEINTDYIEGMDLDGRPNQNRKNAFDDLHVVYTFRDGIPVLLAKAECTTQPGVRYTLRPINQDGAAIIALGYQECWEPGLHRGNYPALIQTGGPCRVYRDPNKTYTRYGEAKPGWYGAGLPALDLKLAHESTVSEDGQPRKVSMEIKALGIGAITQHLGALALGSEGLYAGFLASARNGRGLLFHVTALEGEHTAPRAHDSSD